MGERGHVETQAGQAAYAWENYEDLQAAADKGVGRTSRDAQQRLARAAEAAEAPQVVPPDPAVGPGSP